MTSTLARVPLARILRTPRSWFPIVGWTAFAVTVAIVANSHGRTNGADHVMRGSFGFFVLPLVAYGIVGAVLGGGGLKRSIRGVVLLGADPRRAAFATALVAIAASLVVGGLLAFGVCAIAHGPTDPPLGRDLLASFGVGALGSAAYAAYFAAGSAIGKGWARGVFLAVDWVVGTDSGLFAILTPRGHVTSLLGGPLCSELSGRASSVFLFVLLAGYTAIAVQFARRT